MNQAEKIQPDAVQYAAALAIWNNEGGAPRVRNRQHAAELSGYMMPVDDIDSQDYGRSRHA